MDFIPVLVNLIVLAFALAIVHYLLDWLPLPAQLKTILWLVVALIAVLFLFGSLGVIRGPRLVL